MACAEDIKAVITIVLGNLLADALRLAMRQSNRILSGSFGMSVEKKVPTSVKWFNKIMSWHVTMLNWKIFGDLRVLAMG